MEVPKKAKFEAYSLEEDIKSLEFCQIEKVLRDKNRRRIIFDTNFLFVPFSSSFDMFSEIKYLLGKSTSFYIYEGTLDELESIIKKKTKNKSYVPLIVKMLKSYNFKVIHSQEKFIDEQLIRTPTKEIILATNDRDLRKTLRKEGFKVLIVRQRKYLSFF